MDGYPRLAQLMAKTPPLAIFRRYSILNAQNILYLQVEINELEKELGELAFADHNSDHDEKERYSREWWRLARAQGGDSLQWTTWLELRAKLDQYNSALLKTRDIFNMAQPIQQDVAFLRAWLSRPACGDNFLRGYEASIWDLQNTNDFVALAARPGESDTLTTWTANIFIPVFHCCIGQWVVSRRSKDEEAGFAEYDDSKILGVLRIILTLLSSTVPVFSTVALYLVKGMPLRLAMVAIFTVLFCSILAIFTNARRVEIFAASAAYVWASACISPACGHEYIVSM